MDVWHPEFIIDTHMYRSAYWLLHKQVFDENIADTLNMR